ncbi:glycosyl hydrolase family 18 protein [Balneola sp. MJW-20]|uniref:glycosyl hydrolase family 18 protein n=1 Tax=Gracilimonas aurantiaca TaxID=3234185 RepID=UPI0034662F01
MKSLKLFVLVIIMGLINPSEVKAQEQNDIWVSAYIASWNYNVGGHGNWGNTRRGDIDWDAFTHAIFFVQTISGSTCQPNEPAAWENISPDRLTAFVEDANANSVPAIMSFGGAGNEAFMDCIESAPLTVADGIADFVETWGFDGADIDAEPVRDNENYDVFIQRLRERLPEAILTAAMGGAPSLFARVHEFYDQINIMTYDLSGAWEGWYSWHNSAIYSVGGTPTNIPGSSTEYPNVEQRVNRFIDAGVPVEKLGFGIDLYGYVWTGVNAPQQNAANATRRWAETSYDRLVEEFPGIATDPEWDEGAKAAWYGTDNQFVSFDNQRTIEEKFSYAYEKGVGGMIIWEYTGSKNTLVPVIKAQLTGNLPPVPATPEPISPSNGSNDVPSNVILDWNGVENATSYHVQVSEDDDFGSLTEEINSVSATEYEIEGLENNTDYFWRVRSKNIAGNSAWSETFSFRVGSVSTSTEDPDDISEFSLSQNYPNPFNPITSIQYSIPQASPVELKVFNMLGAEVATLVSGQKAAGTYTVQWDATNFSSGIYIYRITAGNFTQTKKLTLIK